MGTSHDANLVFGWEPPEDFQIPWNNDKYDGEHVLWWLEAGVGIDISGMDYKEILELMRLHPCPFDVDWSGSLEWDRYKILYVPGTRQTAWDGYCKHINVSQLIHVDLEKIDAFTAALELMGVKDYDVKWLMFCSWG